MKTLLREVLLNSLLLYIIPQFLKGLQVKGGVETYVVGGAVLTIGEIIIKPILKIVTLPFNLLTLGFFSSFINVAVFYLITIFYPKIQILAFDFPGFSYHEFHLPAFHVPLLLSYAIISATIYLIKKIAYLLIF